MPSKTRNRFAMIRFLDHLDSEIPVVEGQTIVAITDNLSRGTQESPGLAQGAPALELSVPPHASLLNQGEIFYRRLLKHGIFTSETDLAEQDARLRRDLQPDRQALQVDLYSGKVPEA